MKLNAGSLYKNYLVLYAEGKDRYCIQIDDHDLQWKIYCTEVEFEIIDEKMAKVTFEGVRYAFPYIKTENAMKTLGFGE